MKITFYGAAEEVTGSKHLIETDGFKILLDCGLHQGGHRAEDSAQKLPFDAKSIDCVILSHAHADHCGMLPILVKNGFRGKIYCTTATADIARFIMLDSAVVQQMDFLFAKERLNIPNPTPVMYTKEDAEAVTQYFEPTPYFRLTKQWTQISPNVRLKFYDAGHILGSAVTFLEIKEDGVTKGLAYTGDIGQPGAPILHDPESIEETTDVVISEATYGGTEHKPLSDVAQKLKDVIDFAIHNHSKIVVPAFALGRTQELIYILHDLIDRQIVKRLPIFVDSPLGLNITDVFNKHSEDYNDQTWKDFGQKHELPLAFSNLEYVESVEESKALNTKPGPFMIIASSGMMEGGRILHHLKNNIENPKNTILITGYQAEGTLGRKIYHGDTPVNILGSPMAVNARIITMNELSAHGDQEFLTKYIKSVHGLKNVFLVHTELPQAKSLEQSLQAGEPSFKVTIPTFAQSFEV
jgi:metallo-beta-lactamase family protein